MPGQLWTRGSFCHSYNIYSSGLLSWQCIHQATWADDIKQKHEAQHNCVYLSWDIYIYMCGCVRHKK